MLPPPMPKKEPLPIVDPEDVLLPTLKIEKFWIKIFKQAFIKTSNVTAAAEQADAATILYYERLI